MKYEDWFNTKRKDGHYYIVLLLIQVLYNYSKILKNVVYKYYYQSKLRYVYSGMSGIAIDYQEC